MTVRDRRRRASNGSSVTERAHDEIVAGIHAGRYRPGERLTEARLATDLEVSRVPLREVLKRLAAEGVVELFPHRGAVVRVFTRRDVSELFQMRQALEGLAGELTAHRIDEADNRVYFGELLETTRGLNDDTGPTAFPDYDDMVHGGVVRRSGNTLLVKHWQLLQWPLHRLRHFTSSKTWDLDQSVHDHEQVLTAVIAGDGERARRRMCEHLQRVSTDLLLLDRYEFDAVFNPGMEG